MTLDAAARELLLGFADDELCVGQNLAYWIAVAPFIEVDLAFTSMAQDELAHARGLYGVLGDDSDAYIYLRAPEDYRSCALAEAPCHDWAEAIARHLLYDVAETIRWEALTSSSVRGLPALAERTLNEERFHVGHAIPAVDKVLASATGRDHLGPALQRFAALGDELFSPFEGSDTLVEARVMNASLEDQRAVWRSRIDGVVAGRVELEWPEAPPAAGLRLERSDAFEALHAEMTEVLALDPSAAW